MGMDLHAGCDGGWSVCVADPAALRRSLAVQRPAHLGKLLQSQPFRSDIGVKAQLLEQHLRPLGRLAKRC